MPVVIDAAIPDDAAFWVPSRLDGTDWRLSYFQDVWPIDNPPRDDVEQMLKSENIAIEYIDQHAQDEDDYEDLAGLIESEPPDWPSDEAPDFMTNRESGWTSLEQLEVGVVGLTYSLASLGLRPAASCRSHFGTPSWSPYPVVIFAATREQTKSLQSQVAGAGCGFEIGSDREQMLAIVGPSIRHLHNLARSLLAK